MTDFDQIRTADPRAGPRHVLRLGDLTPGEIASLVDPERSHSAGGWRGATVWLLDESLRREIADGLAVAAECTGFTVEEVGWRQMWSAARRRPTPRGRPVAAAVIAARESDYTDWFARRARVPVIGGSPVGHAPPWLVASGRVILSAMPDVDGRTLAVLGADAAGLAQWAALADAIGLRLDRSVPGTCAVGPSLRGPGGADRATAREPIGDGAVGAAAEGAQPPREGDGSDSGDDERAPIIVSYRTPWISPSLPAESIHVTLPGGPENVSPQPQLADALVALLDLVARSGSLMSA